MTANVEDLALATPEPTKVKVETPFRRFVSDFADSRLATGEPPILACGSGESYVWSSGKK